MPYEMSWLIIKYGQLNTEDYALYVIHDELNSEYLMCVVCCRYDITGLTDRSSEDCDGIEDSVAVIKNLMQKEINSGILSSRIALAGFSQGGAMSLFTGLQLPEDMKPAGILVMSGYLPGASKFKLTPGFEDVLVRHLHGTADAVVIHDHAEKTKAHVTGKGLKNYDIMSFKDVGHTVSPEMMRSAIEFVKSIVPDAPELALKPKLPCDMTVKELKDAIRKAGLASEALGFFEKREFVDLLEKYNKTR
jgi:lysophospholipase II